MSDSNHHHKVSDRTRQTFEDRTEFLSYIPLAEHPSIYGIDGVGFLIYYVSIAIEQIRNYESTYPEDLDFCDLADALAGSVGAA